ncbi:hypothetical protein Ancab_011318 [Ancistrocladus abbreviatus]
MENGHGKLWFLMFSCLLSAVFSETDPNDLRILNSFRKGLENTELLKWPANNDDPCGPPLWPHVFCNGNRVSQIQVQNLGLKGTLPQDFNQLSMLENLGLQKNQFSGQLPTFSGLSQLKFAYLDNNNFNTIPSDFFDGLSSIRVVALDYNPLNATTGWSLPDEVGKLVQLTNLSLISTNLVGPLPDYFGALASLTALKLSYNRLSGVIPMSLNQSMLHILWLNDQSGGGMTGPIDVVASMVSLTQLWLHGNSFTGTIPGSIGDLTSLRDLNLNRNKLVGLIPQSMATMNLEKLDLSNNLLMGPIPRFKFGNVSYGYNSFCQSNPGVQCAPDVNALIDFLGGVNYPSDLSSEWSGNAPCQGQWLGLSCNPSSQVTIINLPNRRLNGTLSPSVAKLDSLLEIRLKGNHLSGQVPANITQLKSLRLLDISGNNFEPPLPHFHPGIKLIVDGNPLLNQSRDPPTPVSSPPLGGSPPPLGGSPPPLGSSPPPLGSSPPSASASLPPKSTLPKPSPATAGSPPPPVRDLNRNSSSRHVEQKGGNSKRLKLGIVVAAVTASVVLALLILAFFLCGKKKKGNLEAPSSVVIHPRDPSDPDNRIKAAVTSNTTGSLFTQTPSSTGSRTSSGMANSHVIESGNLVISVQVLRKVTNNFAPENQLGRGGFGVVYKGELEDGTKIAVKRMEAGVISSKALDEFHAEIAVLSKVRHRHLVSLFGYSTEGNEKLLVYEYMPKGALSRHLFHWKNLNLEPLPWKKRLVIALDVARGMEYLHSLAQQSFIHRDLKSSNILLDDEYRAKVSDFGLVKLAPDREKSVATRLAGTFGYLAPEYAVTGKITTKVDVFSFGVVLMELLTGRMALDEERPEESRYLVEWFWRIKSSKEALMAAIDPAVDVEEEAFESISAITDLAGHCTSRDPNHRPDMGHAVSVLASLVDRWKPLDDETEAYSGINFNLPLREMLKGWKEAESMGDSYTSSSLEDSKGSIPAKPTGFADSFTSADAR